MRSRKIYTAGFLISCAIGARAAWGDAPQFIPIPLTFDADGSEFTGAKANVVQISADGNTVTGTFRAAPPEAANGSGFDRAYYYNLDGSTPQAVLLQDSNFQTTTDGTGMSPDGQVIAGFAQPGNTGFTGQDADIWINGNNVVLPTPDGMPFGFAESVSANHNVVVGSVNATATSTSEATFWTNSGGNYSPTVITDSSGQPVQGTAYAVSSDGSTIYISNTSGGFLQWSSATGLLPSTNQNLSTNPLFSYGTTPSTFTTPQLGIQQLNNYLLDQGMSLSTLQSINSITATQIINSTTVEIAGAYNYTDPDDGELLAGAPYVIRFSLPTAPTAWNNTGSGQWETAPNWTAGIPNSDPVYASFPNTITSAATVTLGSDKTVLQMLINSSYSYTFAGAGTLHLQDAEDPSIQDLGGSHVFDVPIVVGVDDPASARANSPSNSGEFELDVSNATDTMTFNAPITFATSLMALNKDGMGTVVLSANTDLSPINNIVVAAGTLTTGVISGAGRTLGQTTITVGGQLGMPAQLLASAILETQPIKFFVPTATVEILPNGTNSGVSRFGFTTLPAAKAPNMAATNTIDLTNNAAVFNQGVGSGAAYTSVLPSVTSAKRRNRRTLERNRTHQLFRRRQPNRLRRRCCHRRQRTGNLRLNHYRLARANRLPNQRPRRFCSDRRHKSRWHHQRH